MSMTEFAVALDPVLFAKEELGFVPDEQQERILRTNKKRVILNCTRQFGKSELSAIRALHTAIYYPGSLILLLSPSLRQSSELFRKVIHFSRLCSNMPQKTEFSKLFMTLDNGSRLVSLPGRETTVRGYSNVRMIIVDEASQVEDELYYSVRPMLAVSGGSILLLSTPRGKRGFFHGTWRNGTQEWEKFQVKASECKRIPKKFLREELRTLGKWWFSQEYECQFVDTQGQLFSYSDIESMHVPGIRPFFSHSTISSEVKPFFGGN